MGRAQRVGILVFDGVKLLDVAGPSEVFSEANRFGAIADLSVRAKRRQLGGSRMLVWALNARWVLRPSPRARTQPEDEREGQHVGRPPSPER